MVSGNNIGSLETRVKRKCMDDADRCAEYPHSDPDLMSSGLPLFASFGRRVFIKKLQECCSFLAGNIISASLHVADRFADFRRPFSNI
jgi:hypothetical protein